MDQSKFLNIVRRYVWLFVATALVVGLTSYLVLNGRPRVYEAKARLLVGPTVDSPSPDLNSLRIAGQLMETYADLVTTRPILESINAKLDEKINLETLAGMIETRQNADTRILTILVHNQDPRKAAAIANAAAESLVEISPTQDNTTAMLRTQMSGQTSQLEQIISSSQASIQELEAKLITLGDTPQSSDPVKAQAVLEQQNLAIRQLSEERARMSDALRTLATIYQVLLDTNTNQLVIVEPAEAILPVDQYMMLRVAASMLAGLLLVMIVVFGYEYMDDTIRVPGDFNRSVKAPLLTTIEDHHRLGDSRLERVVSFAHPTSQTANSYRTAVAKLLFSIGKTKPYTILLSSVGSQSEDDAAKAAANLAVVFAQAGNRVTLVDAQFHGPMLTDLFEANGKAGLYDLLASKSLEPKLVSIHEMSDLQFLPAGMSSENWSGAMLNSANVVKLVEQLRKDADIVLIAGPAIARFAESLTLASQVNGVILVARYGEVKTKMINEVIEGLNAMNVQVEGVIFEQSPSPLIARRNLTRGSKSLSESGVAGSTIEPAANAQIEKSNPS